MRSVWEFWVSVWNIKKGGGEGVWYQKFVYQKWPDQIFPIVNFVFPHIGHFGLGGAGPPMVVGRSNERLAGGLFIHGYRLS